ncbi:hypothetical protein SEA_HAVEUMETTED_40 [Mycobacterium phage HaveUMetTed]|nr:hypothetical protein SEA_HAVEUMETTED_40 [Mycobacterium phage HaveUMetTed]
MTLVLHAFGYEVAIRARRREQPRPTMLIAEGGTLPVEDVAELIREVM